MSTLQEEKNVISSKNVFKYIDETSDGGYWYTIKDGKSEFVAVTEKALALFGYKSFDELKACGATPHKLIQPIGEGIAREEQYIKFVQGEVDNFYMDCTFINANGAEFYGELFIAHSLVFPHEKDEKLFRVMIHIFSSTEAIFRQSKQLLDEMQSGVVIIEATSEGEFLFQYGNGGYCKVFSWNEEDLFGKYGVSVFKSVYGEDIDLVKKAYNDASLTGETIRSTYRVLDKNRQAIWIKAEHKTIILGRKKLIYVNFINITDLMDIQEEMQKANDKLVSYLNHTPAGIVIFERKDEKYNVTEVNSTMIDKLNQVKQKTMFRDLELTRDTLLEYTIEEMFQFVDPIDTLLAREVIKNAEKTGSSEFNFKINTDSKKDADAVWIHCKVITRTRTNGAMQLIAVYDDISTQVQAQNEIRNKQAKILNMSYHDALTDVLNRLSYNEFMKRRKDTKFIDTGVAFVDVNGLKVINDLYGHSKGDDAIKLTVMLIEHFFDRDEIYRLSGDNFLIIKEDIAQEIFYGKIGKLITEFNKYDIASIGYNWDDNITNITHNIDKAEAAMRVAKHDYYIRHMEDESKHRPSQLNDLRNDINNGRYILYLQPKAYTANKRIIGAESLIRRKEPNGEIIPPSAFVPTIEKERLIPYLDFYMLEETCKALERWELEGLEPIKVSVNMSRVTFAEPDYIKKILAITSKYKIENAQIEFEITESQETMDRHMLEQIIIELSSLGFGVSLDDMGTEYASVMMLTMRGLDTVKIDRGFILQMKSERGRMLVEHIIKMCHDLGEKCIAEGVETDEVRELLYEMGCDMYQGYLLSEPIPVSEFEQLLRQNC